MVERYIEGSGVAWTHLHPDLFMDNLLAAAPVVDVKFYWFREISRLAGLLLKILPQSRRKFCRMVLNSTAATVLAFH